MGINTWHEVEIAIIAAVIVYQIVHSVFVYLNINRLKNIFSKRLYLTEGTILKEKIGKVDFNSSYVLLDDDSYTLDDVFPNVDADNLIGISLISTKGKNDTITRIKTAINTYLINNYGAAVNFSIIKDIVDREINVKDDEITQSVTLPLYLGLAATMIGIIFGLFSMPTLEGEAFSQGVNALIGGVKIAMIGSLTGLVCTTYLSSFSYKKAKRIVQKDKNEQLTYLQATLLPELIKAEDTGVSGLKASLDRFARVASDISDNVLIAANQTGENLELQNDVLDKVNNMEVTKVSKWNLELFEKLDSSKETLSKFSEYLGSMEKISANLHDFSTRTKNIDQVIDNINSTLNDSQELVKFLSVHFDKIESAGNQAQKAVGLAESQFSEAIESLRERTEEMINNLFNYTGDQESKLEQIYSDINDSLVKITTNYVSSFERAYADSLPKFEQLDHLSILPELKEESNKNEELLLNKLEGMRSSLDNLKTKTDNKDIIDTLNSINQKLGSNGYGTNKSGANKGHSGNESKQKSTSQNHDEPTNIGKVIKKLF